ncbi:MAG TPA: PQQ-binding-like beta-propeller repeat protein, partial [Vicinamibacteria bacterium]|nr:PQQ-binding-like beta-propeller repeat protein [Vicinamibacteria bacterium]
MIAAAVVTVSALWGAPSPPATASASREWPAYGGGPAGIRYSPLDQIDRGNVRDLQVAWTYDSGESGGLQANPIVVDGVLYTVTPRHRVVALDAATGAQRWAFDSGIPGRGPNRGVTYWAEGGERRIFTAQDQYLYALDARTGAVIASFGRDGRIDLREDLGRPAAEQSVRLTTPASVFRDLLILGGRVGEDLPASPGYIRAYDARTGRLRWTFRTIPSPGDEGHETWPADAWRYTGGANNWAGMSVDEARGIVYVPTGSAAADFYGGNRLGDNLYANCLLALDARTGRKLWHFQAVRHDVWDRDFPSPPSLVTITRDGRRIDAVAQTSKHGYVFVFDRESGRPLFPIEEKAAPASAVGGERTAATQPVPARPLPFARQSLTEADLTSRTPEARRAVLDAFRSMRNEGPFVPFAVGRDTLVFPGYDGGAEWGGSAFDPETGLLYVNANEMAWTGALAPASAGASGRQLYLRHCASCHRDDLAGAPPQMPSLQGIGSRKRDDEITFVIRRGQGRMPGFPLLTSEEMDAVIDFVTTGADREITQASAPGPALKYRFTGYHKFLDPDGYPAIAPPWGTLTAIDLATG